MGICYKNLCVLCTYETFRDFFFIKETGELFCTSLNIKSSIKLEQNLFRLLDLEKIFRVDDKELFIVKMKILSSRWVSKLQNG